ncbi:PIG-L deacetylase family protein [Caldinitratiruptor microaerophilus]|uniref:PIG-L domain-containing protein n=1 Tax=Caldinitratiruptor microaerophilus TaxID=671077 RepID=A0AA35G5P6_9FIRM|nr:PIG-L deacetylase family protein [Caldinitratiruptor microaerophilus]BDG59851.1 PIG-L domain-containing protein [Caldinitratiruptor microaerophilus]
MDRCLFLSFAHPDDESFLTAGTAARYAEAGVKVVLSTATRGEAGKPGDPPICTRDELPAVREQELRRAAAILGIAEVHFLGYIDRRLGDADPDEAAGRLAGLLLRHRPQVVVTFDPTGSNGHPDHVAISALTRRAVDRARAGGLGEVRLLYTTPTPPWAMADPRRHPDVDFLVDIRAFATRKEEALRAHRTQHLSIDRIFFADRRASRWAFRYETYQLGAGPGLPDGARPAGDLFLGL